MMSEHPEILHPSVVFSENKKHLDRINDWAATHLAALFGLAWTIWIFFLYPLLLLLLPKSIQSTGFFLSSGWIQLWALPLFIYVGNKLQRSTDAQSEAFYKALTHIANQIDDIKASLPNTNK